MLLGGGVEGFRLMRSLSLGDTANGSRDEQVSFQLPEPQESIVTFWTKDGERLEVNEDE